MPLTPSTIKRATDTAGDSIKVFDTSGGEKVQGVVITDEDGNAAGIPTNPAAVELRNSGGTELATNAAPLKTIAPPTTNQYDSSAVETNALAKSGAGVLREIIAILDPVETTVQYLHLFDSIGAPSGAPARRILVPPAGIFVYTPPGGWAFTTGLRVAFSSTLATYTASTTGGVFHVDMD